MGKNSFDWFDAITSVLFLVFGFIIIGTAKSNWFVALGILFMLCGSVQSEENRKRKRNEKSD